MARSVTVFLSANVAAFIASMAAAQRAALGFSGSLNGQHTRLWQSRRTPSTRLA